MGTRQTRASATVTAGTDSFRDFAVVHQKGLNHRYFDGSAVENIAAEGLAIAEDSEDSGQMAINYGSEPMWFRFNLAPNVEFGNVAMYLGGQESVLPSGHFDIVLPKAGGADQVSGDYLFRDQAGFGNTSGLWGILRVGQ